MTTIQRMDHKPDVYIGFRAFIYLDNSEANFGKLVEICVAVCDCAARGTHMRNRNSLSTDKILYHISINAPGQGLVGSIISYVVCAFIISFG